MSSTEINASGERVSPGGNAEAVVVEAGIRLQTALSGTFVQVRENGTRLVEWE